MGRVSPGKQQEHLSVHSLFLRCLSSYAGGVLLAWWSPTLRSQGILRNQSEIERRHQGALLQVILCHENRAPDEAPYDGAPGPAAFAFNVLLIVFSSIWKESP